MELGNRDTADEKLRRLADALSVADAWAKPWQAQFKPGDRFRYPAAAGLDFLGEIVSDRRYRDCLRKLRLCRLYATAYPQEEIFGVYVSAVETMMTPERFALARQHG